MSLLNDLWETLTPIHEAGMTDDTDTLGVRLYALESLVEHEQVHIFTQRLDALVPQLTEWSTTHGLLDLHELALSPSHQPWYLEWILVDNVTMQVLNLAHRHQDKPTDVLSFPTFENAVHGDDHADLAPMEDIESALPESLMNAMRQQGGPLGSVVVSLSYGQGAVQNSVQDLTHYLLERFIHGSLHNMGQHHATDADYQRVLFLQQDFFKYVDA